MPNSSRLVDELRANAISEDSRIGREEAFGRFETWCEEKDVSALPLLKIQFWSF